MRGACLKSKGSASHPVMRPTGIGSPATQTVRRAPNATSQRLTQCPTAARDDVALKYWGIDYDQDAHASDSEALNFITALRQPVCGYTLNRALQRDGADEGWCR